MKGSHRGSSRVRDRRPSGGRKIGRARNRLSKKGRRSSSALSRQTPSSRWSPPERGDAPELEASSAALPLYIRATGTHFGPEERAYTQRKLDQKLGKFATSIERVSVRIDDVNGPRGGVDQMCRMKVVIAGQPSVIAEAQRAKPHAAVDAALKAIEQAVRRNVHSRRTKRLQTSAY